MNAGYMLVKALDFLPQATSCLMPLLVRSGAWGFYEKILTNRTDKQADPVDTEVLAGVHSTVKEIRVLRCMPPAAMWALARPV